MSTLLCLPLFEATLLSLAAETVEPARFLLLEHAGKLLLGRALGPPLQGLLGTLVPVYCNCLFPLFIDETIESLWP